MKLYYTRSSAALTADAARLKTIFSLDQYYRFMQDL